MTKRTSVVAAALAVVLLLSGCVVGTSGAAGGRYNVLTREQIASADVATLYDVVHRLRPRWLNVRAVDSFGTGSSIIVVQGQTILGGVDLLRQLSPDAAYRLRYLDGPTASAALNVGQRNVEAAIVIETAPSGE